MAERDDGGPAFPHIVRNFATADPNIKVTDRITEGGMSLRDYFAGQALAGFMAAGKDRGWGLPLKVAQQAYEFADAMLAARKS